MLLADLDANAVGVELRLHKMMEVALLVLELLRVQRMEKPSVLEDLSELAFQPLDQLRVAQHKDYQLHLLGSSSLGSAWSEDLLWSGLW